MLTPAPPPALPPSISSSSCRCPSGDLGCHTVQPLARTYLSQHFLTLCWIYFTWCLPPCAGMLILEVCHPTAGSPEQRMPMCITQPIQKQSEDTTPQGHCYKHHVAQENSLKGHTLLTQGMLPKKKQNYEKCESLMIFSSSRSRIKGVIYR